MILADATTVIDYNEKMDWITTSIVMFLFSNVLYLLVRKAQKENLPNHFLNLGMFLVPCLFYFPIIIFNNYSFFLTRQTFIIIFITAFCFSYLGNLFSLKSISLSPNPGFSLIISKSYVVFTTLVAVIIFNSVLDLKSALGIIAIVAFSSLIVIAKKGNLKTANNWWLIFSLGAFFCWGLLALVSKYLISQGINIFVYLFYLSGLVSLFIILESRVGELKFSFPKNSLFLILLIGISSALFNLFMQYGYKLAPNPGYINAVNASSISLLTLLSAYFFKDELTLRKIVGVVGVTMGLIILLI